MSMTSEGLRISRLLTRTAGEALVVPRRALVVGTTTRCPVAFQVRREGCDAKGRRIVERWTEVVS